MENKPKQSLRVKEKEQRPPLRLSESLRSSSFAFKAIGRCYGEEAGGAGEDVALDGGLDSFRYSFATP